MCRWPPIGDQSKLTGIQARQEVLRQEIIDFAKFWVAFVHERVPAPASSPSIGHPVRLRALLARSHDYLLYAEECIDQYLSKRSQHLPLTKASRCLFGVLY